MMELEKRLAKTDLSVFKATEFKEEPIKLLAKQIWDLQNFRRNVIAKKINRCGFKQNTISSYISAGLRFIHTGVMAGTANKLFFKTLSECKESGRVAKTPKANEKAKDQRKFGIKATKGSKITPIAFNIKKVVSKPLTETFQYGVQFDKTVKIFDTEAESVAFMQGYSYSGKTCKLVHVSEAN